MTVTIVEQAHIKTVVTKKKSGEIVSETEDQSDIGAPLNFDDHPALVNVSLGYTKNLGSFESLKVQVGVTIPCVNHPDLIASTAEWAKQFCEGKVDEIANGDDEIVKDDND